MSNNKNDKSVNLTVSYDAATATATISNGEHSESLKFRQGLFFNESGSLEPENTDKFKAFMYLLTNFVN